MENYQNAGSGLKKMFIAEVGAIICAVLSIIPIINILAGIGLIVFAVISLVGLYSAGKDIEGCKTAFMITIVNVIFTVLGVFFKTGIFGAIISIVGDILGFLAVYYVCTSVSDVMTQIGASEVSEKGNTVWKINLVCYILMAVIAVLSLIPGINLVAGVVGVVISIVSIVADVLYMIFLSKSSQALEA